MKLGLYEVAKQLSGKLMWGVLALLLILNMAFCYFFAASRTNAELLADLKVADQVYRESPEEITERYLLYKEMNESYEAALEEWQWVEIGMTEGSDMTEPPVEPDIPSTYVEGRNDFELFDKYFARLLTDDAYRKQITSDTDTAMETLIGYKSNGYDVNSYAYRYQIRYLETYQKALEQVKIEMGFAYGWDILFAFSGTGLFIFLASIYVGSRLYLAERDCKMHLLIRTTHHGRGKQAFTKILASLILAILITVLFVASSMAVIGWKTGFSSPFGSVQQIQTMFYCPLSLNMLTCLLLTVAMTVLAAFTIIQVTACCSLLLRRGLLSILAVSVGVGAAYYFAIYGKIHFLKYVNLFTAASAETLLGQWRAIHFFDHPISQLIPLTGMLLLLLLIGAIASVIVWASVGVGVSGSKQSRLVEKISELLEKLPRLRRQSLHLAHYELKKLLPGKIATLCLLLIAVKVILSVNALDRELTYKDEIKLSYMEQYADMTLQEASKAVNERLDHYNLIKSEQYVNDMAVKKLKGEISAAEYSAYRNELAEAMTHSKTLSGFAGELDYLIAKEAETGITAKPVFSTGIRNLLANDFEPILVLLLLILFCGSYAKEYESGFRSLLRSTKRGRSPAFFTKGGFVVGLSLLLALSFTLLDVGLVFAHYDMTCTSAPLFAISTYSNTVSGLTIGEYLVLLTILRTLGYTVLGMLIAALSGTLRREWSAAGVTLLLFIPYLLTGIGLTVFEPFDLTLALSADRLYLYSTALGEMGSLWFLGIFLTVWSAITAVLATVSYRKFCK